MLAVVQVFLPALAGVYSLTIIIAIFSTVSGRLFLIGEHYGGGRRGRTLAIVIGITVLAAAGGAFIPFGRVSNFMFSICGAVGLLICAVVLLRFHTRRRGKEREPWSK